jgi:8-oxo-dGTP pyrophosphatase MutT (NUDIX family)
MSRRHLQFILTGPIADQIELLRRHWDSAMAARAPAHISLVYPEEYHDAMLLIARAADAVRHTAPFTVTLGALGGENGGQGGVWYAVLDESKTWSALRSEILSAPFAALAVDPHVTIVHPRTSNLGPKALVELSGVAIPGKISLGELVYIETASSGARVLERFALSGASTKRMVGAVLRKGDRVLLCLRCRDRIHYPGVWDLPGGHIDEFESPQQALVRELDEELGIRPGLACGGPWETQRTESFEFSIFVIDEWVGEIENRAVHEHEEIRWMTLDEMQHVRLAHSAYVDLLARALKA